MPPFHRGSNGVWGIVQIFRQWFTIFLLIICFDDILGMHLVQFQRCPKLILKCVLLQLIVGFVKSFYQRDIRNCMILMVDYYIPCFILSKFNHDYNLKSMVNRSIKQLFISIFLIVNNVIILCGKFEKKLAYICQTNQVITH